MRSMVRTIYKTVIFEPGSLLETIGLFAFRQTAITSITIPASVITIEPDAFMGTTSLQTVTFEAGSSLTNIASNMFYQSGLTTIYVNSTFAANMGWTIGQTYEIGSKSGVLVQLIHKPFTSADYNGAAVFTILLNDDYTSIADFAFQYNTLMTSITIPNSITSIGTSAFQLATSLTSIIIPNSITSIGNTAFNEATSLASVSFEAGSTLTTIGNYAFRQTAITSITIPASVSSIGTYAFYNVASLTSVTFEAGSSLTNIASNMFYQSGLTTIYVNSTFAANMGWTMGQTVNVGGKPGVLVQLIHKPFTAADYNGAAVLQFFSMMIIQVLERMRSITRQV